MYYPSTSIYLHHLDENFIIALFMDEKRVSWFSRERWLRLITNSRVCKLSWIVEMFTMPEQFTITCALLQVTNLVHIHYLKAARVMGLHQIQNSLRQNLIHQMGRKRYLISVIYSRAKMVKWASSSLV
jgi:hypothetical protein